MPQKIIILGPAYPLRGGGMTTFNEQLAAHLVDQGREVELWSYSLQYPGFLFPGRSQYDHQRPEPSGYRIRSLINSVNPLNWIRIARLLRKAEPDIVFVRYWMSFFGPALGSILRLSQSDHRRVTTLVDNIVPHEPRVIDRPFNAYFIPSSDDFVTLSQDVAQDLSKLTDRPITITPHPLYEGYGEPIKQSLAKERRGLPKDDIPLFLFFGFIRKYKGLDMLLEAMLKLKKKHAKFRCVIAGEFYENREKYEALLQQFDEELILRTDFIPDDEIRDYFCAADYVVLPYHSATQSGVTQIALYYYKPLICTRVGGLPEFVEDGRTGFLCDPSVDSLAESIDRAIATDPLSFHEEIEGFRQNFSWETFIKRVGL